MAGGELQHNHQGLVIIRVALAVLLLIHGITRAYLGTVSGFGEFLVGNGIPYGSGSRLVRYFL